MSVPTQYNPCTASVLVCILLVHERYRVLCPSFSRLAIELFQARVPPLLADAAALVVLKIVLRLKDRLAIFAGVPPNISERVDFELTEREM
jgi:hypothetical protein